MKKVILFLILSAAICSARDTLFVKDFGLNPDARINAVPFINKIMESCAGKKQPVVVFEKGRYDFWPHRCIEKDYFESNTTVSNPRRCAVLIENLSGITIDCGGSDFIFHDRMQPFTIDNSDNVTIKNVNIDWDIPLSAEAEIISVNDNNIDLQIDTKQFPYIIENGKLTFVGEGWESRVWGVMEFERESLIISPNTGDYGCLGDGWHNYNADELADGIVRLNYNFKRKPAAGNYLVLRHSSRDHSGIFITESSDVLLENINMYHNAGLGILAQYSSDLIYRYINCVPNPAKRKILSGHDDGFHYSNCKGQITVENCSFKGLMDDPINVHGTSVQIIQKVTDKKFICKFMHDQSVGFIWARAGNEIGFIENKTMQTIGHRTVESFAPVNTDTFEIAFFDPPPGIIEEGDALENLTFTPDVIIVNNYFGSNRARGILVSTPGKVFIGNNIFESSGSAILIAGDANYWFESGGVKDVTIRENLFKESCLTSMYQFCEGIISIYPEIPELNPSLPCFHRNIKIEDNTFELYDYPVLYSKSVDGIKFNGNLLKRTYGYKPFHQRKYGFTFEACRNVEILHNRFEGDVLGRKIKLIDTDENQIQTGNKGDLTIEK